MLFSSAGSRTGGGLNWRRTFFRSAFGQAHRLALYKQLSTFQKDGVDIVEALKDLEGIYTPQGDWRGAMFSDWLGALAAGTTLVGAMGGSVVRGHRYPSWIPQEEVMLLAPGEESGDLASAFDNAVEMVERKAQFKAVLMSEFVPLGIYLVFFCLLMAGFSIKGTPAIAKVFPVSKWPESGKLLYNVTAFIRQYGIFVAAGAVAGLVMVIWRLPTWAGQVRERFNMLPPWRFHRMFCESAFLLALAAMLRGAERSTHGGQGIKECLERIGQNSSPFVSWYIRKMLLALDRGLGKGEALCVSLLGRETQNLVKVYANRSNFTEAVAAISRQSIELGLKEAKGIIGFMKTIVLAMLAGSILWFYLTFLEINGKLAESSNKMSQKLGTQQQKK